jgi:regulator of sigma E protease
VTYLVVIVGLLMLVFLHELGHFLAARAVGMKPRKFYVGFPPALAKVKRNGVEYGIGTIPLGGYVRIPGMHRPAARDFDVWIRPALHEESDLAPVVQRIRRELDAENYSGVRDDLPELTSIVETAELSPGARRSADRALREVEEGTGTDAYWRQPTWKRLVVIAAGPAANVLVAFVIFFFVFLTGAPTDKVTANVAQVQRGTPAAVAGLHAHDRIVAVNGAPTPTFDSVSAHIRASHGKPITVTVVRHGNTVKLGPRATIQSADGRWVWGFVPTQERTLVSYGALSSLHRSGALLGDITTGTGSAIGGLFHKQERQQLTGTVGIVRASAAALKVGLPWYLQILGLVSMSLALLNLLPLLPLDGGHIAMSIIEFARRKAVAREVYERVSVVGLAIVLFIAFIALNNDLTGGPR